MAFPVSVQQGHILLALTRWQALLSAERMDTDSRQVRRCHGGLSPQVSTGPRVQGLGESGGLGLSKWKMLPLQQHSTDSGGSPSASSVP